MEQIYTPKDVMKILQIKEGKYYQLIRDGYLEYCIAADGRKYILESQLEKYVKATIIKKEED